MAREYDVASLDAAGPYIERVYDRPGLSWRVAKKRLRQHYLDKAAAVRALRERDAIVETAQDLAEQLGQ